MEKSIQIMETTLNTHGKTMKTSENSMNALEKNAEQCDEIF